MACTTVDCLPPITGPRKVYPWVTPLVLGSLENKDLKSVGYVIERTRGAVGYGGKPKVSARLCAARVGNRGWSPIT